MFEPREGWFSAMLGFHDGKLTVRIDPPNPHRENVGPAFAYAELTPEDCRYWGKFLIEQADLEDTHGR